jgi:hypothetical protein
MADLKHGSWGYFLSYGSEPDPTNPQKRLRRQFRKMGFPTKQKAQSALAKLRAQLDDNVYVEPSKITLAEYARQWLKRLQTTGKGLKPTTAANYQRYVEQDIIRRDSARCCSPTFGGIHTSTSSSLT